MTHAPTTHRPRVAVATDDTRTDAGWCGACTGCAVISKPVADESTALDIAAAHCTVANRNPVMVTREESAAFAMIKPATFGGYVSRKQTGVPQPGEMVGRTPRWVLSGIAEWCMRRAKVDAS
jgi:predicted DNA-binding transcriptional regulator AlpA